MNLINLKRFILVILLLINFIILAPNLDINGQQSQQKITWGINVLDMLQDWYKSKEAKQIADNVLLYQRDVGGWEKNIDMAKPLNNSEKDLLKLGKSSLYCTFDNDTTTTQIRFLALIYSETNINKYKDGVLKGLDFIFASQYENGGWPQYYPKGSNAYQMNITYNDDNIVRILNIMLDILNKKKEFSLVDSERVSRAKKSYEKGIDCILKTQISVNGKLTAWCAQHDQKTLKPAMARSYEHISISGEESVGIIELLMKIENPSQEIINAIQSAVSWFNEVKISGIKVVEKKDPTLPEGFDVIVVNDPNAPWIWARFYEIGTNQLIFSGRDSIIKRTLAEIEHERRINYHWYTNLPLVLYKLYPQWQQKWAKDKNILQ